MFGSSTTATVTLTFNPTSRNLTPPGPKNPYQVVGVAAAVPSPAAELDFVLLHVEAVDMRVELFVLRVALATDVTCGNFHVTYASIHM